MGESQQDEEVALARQVRGADAGKKEGKNGNGKSKKGRKQRGGRRKGGKKGRKDGRRKEGRKEGKKCQTGGRWENTRTILVPKTNTRKDTRQVKHSNAMSVISNLTLSRQCPP